MDRLTALKEICKEFNGSRLARKLSSGAFDELVAFIEDNAHLAFLDFEYAVNRWHLMNQNKPKNLFVMHELALSANTRAYHQRTE